MTKKGNNDVGEKRYGSSFERAKCKMYYGEGSCNRSKADMENNYESEGGVEG